MALQFVTRVVTNPKQGSSPEEYEDAYCVSGKLHVNTRADVYAARASQCRQYAVADGATTSSFSKEWAKILVESFARKEFRPTHKSLWLCLERLQTEWKNAIPSQDLPWYAQEKLRQGSFAAFLGLRFTGRQVKGEANSKIWQAMAIGDTCLFQVRANRLIASFPMRASHELTSTPVLLSTRRTANLQIDNALRIQSGSWAVGDYFLLMTDAIAGWFLRQVEVGEHPWAQLNEVASEPAHWQTWLDQQRAERLMRNDDTTLVTITVEE